MAKVPGWSIRRDRNAQNAQRRGALHNVRSTSAVSSATGAGSLQQVSMTAGLQLSFPGSRLLRGRAVLRPICKNSRLHPHAGMRHVKKLCQSSDSPAKQPNTTPSPPRPVRSPYQLFQLGFIKGTAMFMSEICDQVTAEDRQALLNVANCTSLRTQSVKDLKIVQEFMSAVYNQLTEGQKLPFICMAHNDQARYDMEFQQYMSSLMA